MIDKPILVIGSPRSGTSWVGKVIKTASSVRYIHEPFNISSQSCQCGVRFDYWFYYLTPKKKLEYYNHLLHIIDPSFSRAGFLNLIAEIKQKKRVRSLFSYLQSYYYNRPVLKDPIAILSAEQLSELFDMEVVVIIRHPAAFVNSYKVLNWSHSFSDFLRQPELMEDYFVSYRPEIEDFSNNEYEIVDQAALLWKLIHVVICQYQERHPEWIFIRHEDLTLNPIKEIKKSLAVEIAVF